MLDLGKLGKYEIVAPTSMAIALDFVSVWGSEPTRAVLGRVCAGAIGVCVDHAKILPAYKPLEGDVIGYGYTIMDRLLANGITPGQIYTMGTQCLLALSDRIPTEKQVEDTANFTQPRAEG